jgi:hypothetical protein
LLVPIEVKALHAAPAGAALCTATKSPTAAAIREQRRKVTLIASFRKSEK